ncbi:MAG: hypothetical protein WCB51_01000 [Candidatus Dormiibacterota bacterium]
MTGDAVAAQSPPQTEGWWRAGAEGLALLLSPFAAFFGLRLTLMAPPDLNDPAMHTAFIVDPHDVFVRFTALLAPTDRLREGARVGFLVPARISYLLFGAVPGFAVLRYVLALIAVIPAYLLMRRMYNRVAGIIVVIVILSCPVVILAWGTDFPDSAALSYLIGGLACLAMPSVRHRVGWLIGAGVLFTMALWALATSAPLIIVTLAVYARIAFTRDRGHLLRDIAAVGGSAVAVTGLLVIASGLLIGPFDYIQTTIQSLIYLAQPSQVRLNHSASPFWAPYITYLLVVPTVIVLWFIAFASRLRNVPTPQLLIGMSCLAQFGIFSLLQLFGGVQDLEVHYFSSLLWSSVCLTLAIALVEFGRPLLADRLWRWAVPALLVAVPLIFEIHPRIPQFGWLPWGFAVAALILLVAWGAIGVAASATGVRSVVLTGGTLVAITGGLLGLTVTPTQHAHVKGTIDDTFPAYAGTLGGNDTVDVDLYSITTQLPGFVGPAAYSGEELVTWWSDNEIGYLREPIGMYHAFFNSIPSDLGPLIPAGAQFLDTRRPAQVLLMSFNGSLFPESLQSLAPYQPEVVKTGVLRAGSLGLHLWLVDLKTYIR